MAGGYIEINDTNSIIRGTMAGVDGTFSGTFSSNNIDVISSVHVRDGAVSAYYHFHFDKGRTDYSFTLLKQPFTSIVDIVIPASIEEAGSGSSSSFKPSTITVYKNGVVFSHKVINPGTSNYVSYISALRIVDFNVNSNTTYRIEVKNHYYYSDRDKELLHMEFAMRPKLYSHVDLQGLVSVGFRKR